MPEILEIDIVHEFERLRALASELKVSVTINTDGSQDWYTLRYESKRRCQEVLVLQLRSLS